MRRAFIVRVSDAPRRVVVEDVREGRRAVVDDLGEVGDRIGAWLESPNVDGDGAGTGRREDSVSGQP
jgi:hypothetical protein